VGGVVARGELPIVRQLLLYKLVLLLCDESRDRPGRDPLLARPGAIEPSRCLPIGRRAERRTCDRQERERAA